MTGVAMDRGAYSAGEQTKGATVTFDAMGSAMVSPKIYYIHTYIYVHLYICTAGEQTKGATVTFDAMGSAMVSPDT